MLLDIDLSLCFKLVLFNALILIEIIFKVSILFLLFSFSLFKSVSCEIYLYIFFQPNLLSFLSFYCCSHKYKRNFSSNLGMNELSRDFTIEKAHLSFSQKVLFFACSLDLNFHQFQRHKLLIGYRMQQYTNTDCSS